MRVAQSVKQNPEQRSVLEQHSHARSMPARLVERARIVLRTADGLQDKQIAEELSHHARKSNTLAYRFLDGGLSALQKDAPRSGGPRTITDKRSMQVIEKTTQEKPDNATHWSTRTMAAAVELSEASIRRIWHAHGLKPHLVRSFKVNNDPQLLKN